MLLLVGSWLFALRGLDLQLAGTKAPDPDGQPPWIWLLALLGTALVGGLTFGIAQRFHARPRARSVPRVSITVGIYGLFLLGAMNWPQGLNLVLWPLRSTLETALVLLLTLSVIQGARQHLPRIPQGWITALAILHLGVHAIEQALGHAVLPLPARCALQAGLLASLAFGLVHLTRPSQSFENRVTALCLGIPLLVRLACVGSWTALLGVPVPESLTGITLGVWGISNLVLCACTFPRQKGMPLSLFGLCSGLGTGAIFLVFFHYLHRFGRIQVFFEAFSTTLLGVHLPYPQWHPPAFAAAFAVSCVFVFLLVLRTLGTTGQQRRGLALSLWMATGVGLTRSMDLVLLLFVALALAGTSPAQKHSS